MKNGAKLLLLATTQCIVTRGNLPPYKIPSAFLAGQSANKHVLSSRFTARNQYDVHDRSSQSSPSSGEGRRLRSFRCRSSCTKIYVKQVLEEDTDVKLVDTAAATENIFNINNAIDEQQIDNEGNSEKLTTKSIDQSIPEEFIPILALCFLVASLSALDRIAMSIAILPMATELDYTETIKGQIGAAVSYGYGLAILPIGLAVSVVSSRQLMLLGVSLWSFATLCTPLMAELSATSMSILPLLLIRAVMGGAEAVVLPTMQRLLANWVPAEKKATVLSIVISGFHLGTIGAYLASPLVLDFMSGLDGGPADVPGWRGMFYVYGLAGLIWLIPWSIVAKDAPTANALTVEEDCEETFVNNMIEDDASLVLNECEIIDADGSVATTSRIEEMKSLLQSAPWEDFVKSPGVWGMTLAHAAKNFELYNLLAWTPTFFSEQYGLNVKESAAFSILPSICGMVGGLTAGSAADFILAKSLGDGGSKGDSETEKRTKVRKLFQGIALLGPAACLYLLSNLPDRIETSQILLGGAVGLQAFDSAGFGAASQEKAGERWAGLLYSLTSLPGVLVGSVSVSVTGQLLDMMADKEGHGWTTVFQLNAAICVAGALAFLLLYDSKKEFE